MPEAARLRKIKLNKNGYAVDTKEPHDTEKGKFWYRADIPAGITWYHCYEVKAATYKEAKARIEQLAWRQHKLKPTWAK